MARPPETLRADPFFPSFIAGLESVLAESGYALLLQVVAAHDREHQSYRRFADEGRVDGVFVTDLYVDDPRPALLAEVGLPAVVVGPALGEPFWPAVGVDDGPGMAAAVRRLVTQGHQRIGHVAGPQHLVHGRSRRDAWSTALRDAGLPPGPWVEADFSAEGGAAATSQLLDRDPRPTAIVYANDLMAMAGMSAALHRGIDVPGQLSIAGFDDTELAAHVVPSLTTVNIDVVAWGRAAATRLLELIDGRPPSAASLHPARLIERDSTGPAPEDRVRSQAPPRARLDDWRTTRENQDHDSRADRARTDRGSSLRRGRRR